MHAAATRALLALGAGDFEEVVSVAEHSLRISNELPLAHPGYESFRGNLIEAHIRTHQLDQARSELEILEGRARERNHVTSMMVCARNRLLLAEENDFDLAAEQVMGLLAQTAQPFVRARTTLVLGEQLRRVAKWREARVMLLTAHREFSRLGAPVWAQLALDELRAAGGRVRQLEKAPPDFDSLRAQEQRVVRIVANGSTNHEAAEALFINQKSVERHLTSIYRKLGIRSRSELVRLYDHLQTLQGSPPPSHNGDTLA